jgi:hypothetical protein
MRLWSISPSYLDKQGLCGLWRESLLGQSCLLKGEYTECPDCSLDKKFNGRLTPELGDTSFRAWIDCPKCAGTGKIKTPYWNHPQLHRFRQLPDKSMFLSVYLHYIYDEGIKRGYKFDIKKIDRYSFAQGLKGAEHLLLTVTRGQLEYEFKHLQYKLRVRSPAKYKSNSYYKGIICKNRIKANPLFKVIDGDVESWEKIKKGETK